MSSTFKLSSKKRALLDALLQEEGIERDLSSRIPRRTNEDNVPLSFAQQRLWFLYQLQPDGSAYNVPTAVRLQGHIDISVLERCFKEILRRHEVLRTSFKAVNGQPIQVVASSLVWNLPVVELPESLGTDREALVLQLAVREAKRPFDLAQGPLLRATLLRLSKTEHVLLLTMHHIVSDGWSTGIMIRELTALYTAFSNQQSSPLPELPVQYADFAVWQRERLQGETLDIQLDYWLQQLGAPPAMLALPTDYARPAVQTFRGKRLYFELPLALTDALKTVGYEQNVTLFMTLLAAFQVLLYRYTGQEDILVGSPIANRNRTEIEGLVGFFVNTLVMRTDLSHNPNFGQLLQRVRAVAEGAYTHQDLPFEKLVEELNLERSLSHSPLFQVMFTLQNAPEPAIELPGLTLHMLEFESGATQFDLLLEMWETPGGLRGSFNYNTDLFEAATITRMAKHFQILLESIVCKPSQRIANLSLLTSAEERQMVVTWNDTAAECHSAPSLCQLFEAHAERFPDRVALVGKAANAFEKTAANSQLPVTLTYRELNKRANQLAHYLCSLGAGSETLIGICVERSIEMVIGLLGILKAGGAYVPLDPSYPEQRLAFILEDTQSPILLTQQPLLDNLPDHNAQVVCLGVDWPTIASHSETNLLNRVTSENLAYIIYTSGSTGRPKGVAITHKSAIVMLEWAGQFFAAADLGGVLAATSICFDLSVFELFLPLSWGAKIILAENALELPRLVAADAVTLINTVPSAMAELVRLEGIPSSVHTVNLAGEPLKRSLVQHVYEQPTVHRVFNLYGPSEDTTYSTWALMQREVVDTPSIGRPVANTQIYLLDSHLQPVPIGVSSELYIGGMGLSRGYLDRPDLTAEKFIPNPFSQEPGERLYRTGDLARYRLDGEIDFLGRMDHQVKIRGFRIELGEIEATLTGHPGLRESVVLAHNMEHASDSRGAYSEDKRLVAYIVPEQQPAPSITELRSYLWEKLTEYMVPSIFIFLDALPLTPNGKVDRRALPAPDGARPEMDGKLVLPRTPVEELTARLWTGLLNLENVSIYDNFFELGGHSLLATQLSSRLRDTFQVNLSLEQIFEAPTIAGMATKVDGARKKSQGLSVPSIKPIPREMDLPLSFAQQRAWFLEQMSPGNFGGNLLIMLRVNGLLDLTIAERVLNEIVRRHESLRTTFSAVDGRPVQVIAAELTLPLLVIDLQELSGAEQEVQVRQLAVAEERKLFDLVNGPLMRVTLLRLAEAEHILFLAMHHIITDGWSIGVLIRDVTLMYQAFFADRPSPLADLPIQYADFAYWQRQWLHGEGVLDAQMAYWKKQLIGAPTILDLPTDRPRPAIHVPRGALQPWVFSQSLFEALEELSRREGATLFMTLIAALNALFYRYTGQDDILIGTPIANRNWAEIEDLIGYFVNTLVIRTNLAGNPSFRELLGRVRKTALGAYAHQDLPFEQLVDALEPERDLSRHALFQVLFIIQNAPMPDVELPGLTIDPIQPDSGAGNFDLSLFIVDSDQGPTAMLEYNTVLFERATILRMLGHFQTLIEGAVADPEQKLSELPLLTVTEEQQILQEWNVTGATYPDDKCFHQLFEVQAEQAPDAVAIIFNDQHLTYRELNRRANQLAHYLQGLGVEPEVLVGLYVERSLEMVIGILGVLKAGGAYVPLDPSYPQERLAFMLGDAQAAVLLTQERLIERLPEYTARVYSEHDEGRDQKVVCLDIDWKMIAEEGGENPVSKVTPDNLAYVIYTSGSTGWPKGVLLAHRGLCNVSQAQIRTFGLAPKDRVLQFASLNFDASVFEIIMALRTGAVLCLATRESLLPGPNLVRLLQDWYVTIVTLTPSALAALPAEVYSALRIINVAGESCSAELVARWGTNRQFFNLYGPTEGTIWTTATECTDGSVKPPIGRPIDNTQIYLLDAYQKPVPIGVSGELCIAGAGLAWGYLERPDLTAQAFIPHPFSEYPGARLYCTGDLARYLPDGDIEFLGRIDHQVKIRGFRIELGEIEATLTQHAAVEEAVVVASLATREDGPTDRRLVAYVVPVEEQEPAVSELRGFLQQKLPDYMVPSHLMMLEALPLTPNGKVDRHALPAPDPTWSELERDFVAPRTPAEDVLAGIWAQILGIERVSVTDNFFELGGHSLLATQVISRIRQTFQVELSLRDLFATPTVAGLSECIEVARHAARGLTIPPLLPAPRQEELPLSFAQQRLWFLDQLEPNSAAYNIPIAMRLAGRLDLDALEKSLNEVVRRHEALRTTFATVEGQPLQAISPVLPLLLSLVDLRALSVLEQEALVRCLVTEEAQRPFDLAHGPLLRATLLRLEEQTHVLLLTVHHIVSDGWSMGILVGELAELYQAFSSGAPAQLHKLPIQYADFAVWQREWLQGKTLETQLSYWKRQLGQGPSVLELPTDRPRPPVQTFHGAYHSFALPEPLFDSLKSLSRREGVTLFMTLLAAFQTLLARYTGQTDVAVGSPIANRNQREIEGLIGFFVNTLVLRADLSGNPTFREILARVREVTLDAYTHQDLPFEMLVDVLQPRRDLCYPPLFQVLFVFQNAPAEVLELPELTLSPLEIDTGTAKFDLTLTMVETEQGLRGELEYNTDLFDALTMARLAHHFLNLLQDIVATTESADQRLWDLALFTDAERHQMLVEWNDTGTDYPGVCLHELFEAQVERTPQAMAVVSEDHALTYGELNGQANQLAHYLQALGVGPEVLVGVCMERSLEMIVGILGVLKAGGAYVPLDPKYPQERTAFILADTHTPVILTQQHLVEALPAHSATVLCLDADWHTIALSSRESLAPGTPSQCLAYVIYTSGSTGAPKGVAIRHQSAVALVHWALEAFDRTLFAATLASTSVCFDLSIFELFVPLSCGGNVILAQNLLHLPTLPAAAQVTLVNTVPSAMTELLRLDDLPPSVSAVNLAGEPLPTALVMQIYHQSTARQVFDLYGPSEDTTYSTYALRHPAGPETIGRPVANAQVYLLDAYLNPVPIGVPGELYLGGDGLARGYLYRPHLTAERFIPAPPFTSSSWGRTKQGGARLYRTGDLARYRRDGNVEFLGRIDHQVKIRGFRIELGEIEATLIQHAAVQEAVVVASLATREGEPTDKRLVAYVVPVKEQAPAVSELRGFLQQKLPDYMVPSHLMMLEALPLTPNGKVDRRALPTPERAGLDVIGGWVAPRDVLEHQLVQIWQDVLDLQPVGVTDDFFELGGHSLLAVRLMARIQGELGQQLPLTTLFQNSTVEELAVVLRHQRQAEVPFSSLVPIQVGEPDRRPLFFVHPGGGHVFCYADLSRHLGPAQSFYGLQAQGLDNEQEPHTEVNAMASHYVELLQTVQPKGPYRLGGWSVGGVVAFEMAQQLWAQGQDVSLLALVDSHAPTHNHMPEPDDATLLLSFALDLGLPLEQMTIHLDQIEPTKQLTYVLDEAKRAGVVPLDVKLSQVRRLFHIFKSNVQAMLRYAPQVYAGPIVLFKAREQPSEMDGALHKDLGWGQLAAGGLLVQEVPGSHYTLMREPNVKILAEQLESQLNNAG